MISYDAAKFTVNATAFQNLTSGGAFSVAQKGNQLLLEFNAVPEPGTWALLFIGTVDSS